MSKDVITAYTAIICLTALEMVNMITTAYDSSTFYITIAAIAGLGGYVVSKWIQK